MNTHDRFALAHDSLQGLSVGDAFGEKFFIAPQVVGQMIAQRALPAPPWGYTDDTQMALSIVEVLARHGGIVHDALARSFAEYYDVSRGYGPAMHGLLQNVRLGVPWSAAVRWLFNGQGSFGNGAAMRVAPLGAYFADDLDAVVEHARRSAEVTHAHPEGVAGAIVVAVATAWAVRLRGAEPLPSLRGFLELVLPQIPAGKVRDGAMRAAEIPPGTPVAEVGLELGTGGRVSAQDTVPFTLWCAGQHLDNYAEALWLTVSGLGDRDTTCAIVGGIVAAHTGTASIPAEWMAAREPLPDWYLAQ